MADEAFSADSKWMTGDWGGERTKLIEQGIDIKTDYVGEVGGNLHGGYNDDKTGATPTSLVWAWRWTCKNCGAGITPRPRSSSPTVTARTSPTTASATRVPAP